MSLTSKPKLFLNLGVGNIPILFSILQGLGVAVTERLAVKKKNARKSFFFRKKIKIP